MADEREKAPTSSLLDEWRAAERAAFAAGEAAQAARKAADDAATAAETAGRAAAAARTALELARRTLADAEQSEQTTDLEARRAGARADAMNHARDDALAAEDVARERYDDRERHARESGGEPSLS